jgi:hypothetical protein
MKTFIHANIQQNLLCTFEFVFLYIVLFLSEIQTKIKTS